ncbi:hypothetical protein T12_5344 [Trichinella patagoniensis]|uniref:Uncharacterized protein n=1 Tax=Trichinella patagoniensis TaxID=990121 RepID=A0A0V0Z5F6_9BILA|nr:hypothetical protein T12_5344 [Trichinella patagoniensis]
MRYLIFTSRGSTRKRVLALSLSLLWLLASWNSLAWLSVVSSIKRKRGRKITEDALNDSMRMKCEESIWPANPATLQWALGGVSLSDVPSRDGPQNVASLIEGLHLSAEHHASENFVFERCLLNNVVPAKLYPLFGHFYGLLLRNHTSVEEYSELGRRACVIQNAAFYPVLQRTIVETASLCCPHAGMVNFGRGMLDIGKTEETFRGRRRGNLEINKIDGPFIERLS